MSDQTPDDVLIEDHGTYIEAQFLGQFLLKRFVEQIAVAAKACREHKRSLLLIDATQILGQPSTFDRYEFATKAASLAHGLKVAAYARSYQLDKLEVMVSRNRGLQVEEFSDREKALAWLVGAEEQR